MLIPSKYVLEDGKDAPEGTVLKKCKYCGRSFGVPVSEADSVTECCDDEECKKAADKEAAAQAAALMKSSDAADTVKTALGN